jgi:3-oxoacyl-[acyl-carrier-protein] synthase II
MGRALNEVVVTGVGAITPLGARVDEMWAGLLAARSGIVELGFSDADGESAADHTYSHSHESVLPTPVGLMAADPADALTPAAARRLDRAQQAALVAAREAWADAGSPDVDPDQLATVIGTGIGGLGSLLRESAVLRERGIRRVSPRAVPMLMANAASAVVSIEFGAQGGAYTPVSACSSGAEALAMGARLIRAGEADIVIAGGTEAAVAPVTVAGFRQARALSQHIGDPASASRPFAVDRSGFVLGEGAGVVVLESADHAARRGARVRAVLAGAGITSDAHHITAPSPDGRGQISAMRKALAQAGIDADRIGHVNAHATGTPTGDAAEADAIAETFGRAAVTAPKAALGHLFGAAGSVEAIVTILALEQGIVPPTRNLGPDDLDPAIDLDVVTAPRDESHAYALSNSFGFGGQNVSLVFGRA